MSNQNNRAFTWWRLGLLDGEDFYKRGRSMTLYSDQKNSRASELRITDLYGPFCIVYHSAFKLGYSTAKNKYSRDKFWSRRKRPSKLHSEGTQGKTKVFQGKAK